MIRGIFHGMPLHATRIRISWVSSVTSTSALWPRVNWSESKNRRAPASSSFCYRTRKSSSYGNACYPGCIRKHCMTKTNRIVSYWAERDLIIYVSRYVDSNAVMAAAYVLADLSPGSFSFVCWPGSRDRPKPRRVSLTDNSTSESKEGWRDWWRIAWRQQDLKHLLDQSWNSDKAVK